jgi:preprotein translocase subunit SecA
MLPAVRKDDQDLVYKTKREKYGAVIDEIVKLRERWSPNMLVGTTSVEVSELLSRMLQSKTNSTQCIKCQTTLLVKHKLLQKLVLLVQ